MTSPDKYAEDREYRLCTVRAVEPAKGGGWIVTDDEGWSLFVTGDECPKPPEPGESMKCYGEGIGRPVRGIEIGGRVYRYRSAVQARLDSEEANAEAERKKVQEYEANRAAFEERIMALPHEFRSRIDGFRAARGARWRIAFEGYELFVCEQAVAFAAHFDSLAALQAWAGMKYDEQRVACPALSDQHSGNTFGAAVRLAALYMERPEDVARQHGALCPLVGCEEYGCWAARKEAVRG